MLNLQTRELVLKWNKEGKKQEQIAALVGCNQSSISRLIRKYKKTGSVKNLPRSGRPTPLTKKALAVLKAELTRKVKEANKSYCSIDTKQFSDLIENALKKKCLAKFDMFITKNLHLKMKREEFLDFFNNHLTICVLPEKEKRGYISWKQFKVIQSYISKKRREQK